MTGQEHLHLRELLGAYVLGHLEGEEAARVEAHLPDCELCRADLAELGPVAERLAHHGVPDDLVAPSPQVLGRILGEIAPPEPANAAARGRGLPVWGAAAAMVAVAVASAAITTVVTRPDPGAPREPVAVAAPEAVSASAELIDHTWGVEIILTVDGMAAGQRFDVVVEDADGEAVTAGSFVGVDGRTVVCRMNAAVLRSDATSFRVLGVDGTELLTADLTT